MYDSLSLRLIDIHIMISKAVLVGLLVVGAVWLHVEKQAVMGDSQEFQDWMREYKVEFASLAEQYYRARIFHKNVESINQHNQRTDVSYKMAINQFTIYTEEEFAFRFLSQLRIPQNEVQSLQSQQDNTIEIDWQAKGAVGAVKNQGVCGGAGIYSTIGGIEGLAFVTTGKFEAYSDQQLIDCVFGCSGGTLLSGYQYLKTHGACTEKEYPFTGKQGTCNSTACSFKISGIQSINSCPALESAIKIQPVSVAVDASRWSTYSSGIFNNCGTALNHMVLLTAMDTDFWRAKNSWGTAWGEKGFIRLARGNTCGICMSAVVPTK